MIPWQIPYWVAAEPGLWLKSFFFSLRVQCSFVWQCFTYPWKEWQPIGSILPTLFSSFQISFCDPNGFVVSFMVGRFRTFCLVEALHRPLSFSLSWPPTYLTILPACFRIPSTQYGWILETFFGCIHTVRFFVSDFPLGKSLFLSVLQLPFTMESVGLVHLKQPPAHIWLDVCLSLLEQFSLPVGCFELFLWVEGLGWAWVQLPF